MSSIDKFKEAQARDFETALSEMQAGRKTSHWIWYVFPQLTELGRSSTAKFYGISDLHEAVEYLSDSVLRERLLQITRVVAQQLNRGAQLDFLMGGKVDAVKIVSSLTLFELAAREYSKADPSVNELRELLEVSEAVLFAADKQGFARCQVTFAAVER